MRNPTHHTRGILPHLEVAEATQFLTWRLADAIPPGAWDLIRQQTESLPEPERRHERVRWADRLLDSGQGSAVLRHGPAAKAVEDTLWHGQGKRYRLEAYVVMPNHVHVVLTQSPGASLSDILRTIKSFSAREVNRVLGRTGPLWQIESFDRLIRNPEHLCRTIEYVEWNPVKAKLVSDPRQYRYSSAFPPNAERLQGS